MNRDPDPLKPGIPGESANRRADRPGAWISQDEDSGEADEADPLRPSAWRAFTLATALCWDYLGLTILGSVVSFVSLTVLWILLSVAMPGRSLFMLLLRLSAFLVPATAFSAGAMRLAVRISFRDEPSPRDLWDGWREFGGKALALGALNGATFAALTIDALFWLTRPQPLLRWIALPFFYGAIFWAASVIYQAPALVRLRLSPFGSYRQSFLLLLANPAFTLFLCFVMILGMTLSVLTMAPLALFAPMAFFMTEACALDALILKYETLEKKSE